jgi:hypothetical protein
VVGVDAQYPTPIVKNLMPDDEMPCTAMSWALRAQHDACVPPWKGSLLRGALGWALERTAAGAPAPAWPGLRIGTTLTTVLLDPQGAWSSPLATPPAAMQCTDERTRIPEGDTLQGRLLLFGEWPAWALALLGEGFADAALHGLGAQRHPFRLVEWTAAPETWPEAPAQPTALELRTLTPCRLMDRKAECCNLHPPAIARSLLRRWRQLHRQLQGSDPAGDHQALAQAADQLQASETGTITATIKRWSNRQSRHVDMPGLTGSVTITGDSLPLLAPYLARAPLLHIGKQPVFGLGQVELAWRTAADSATARNESCAQPKFQLQDDPMTQDAL